MDVVMSKKSKAGGRRNTSNRGGAAYRDGMQVDADGLPIVDAPTMSWRARYHTAFTRYCLCMYVAPYVYQYVTRTAYVDVIVEDLVKHVYLDWDYDRPMDYGDYTRRYIHRVEGALDGGDEEELRGVWTAHAEQLQEKYGSTMERWIKLGGD